MMMIKPLLTSLRSDSYQKKRNNLLLIALLLISVSATAQVSDFQSWLSVGVNTDISKKFSAGIEAQLRMRDNSTRPNSVLLDPGISFKVNKYLKFAVGYRFSARFSADNVNTTAHRYNVDAEGRKKFGKLTLKLRTRFQKGFTDLLYNENREPYSYPAYSRNKLAVEYELNKRFSPFAEFELFLPLNNPRQRNFDRYRATIGSSFDLKNRNTIDCFFRVQQELNTANPETDFIIGIGYAYDVKLSKKKKKDKDKKDEKSDTKKK